MRDYSNWSYESLKQYLVVCYYACDHDAADEVLYEMERRREYYDDDDL